MLKLDHKLEIFKNSAKEAETTDVDAFGFISYEKAVICSKGQISIISIPQFQVLTQTTSNTTPIGITSFSDKFIEYGLVEKNITIKVFSSTLNEL